MLEAMVFAITLVVAQTVAWIIIIGVMMSKTFLRKYYKWFIETMQELNEIVLESEEEEA